MVVPGRVVVKNLLLTCPKCGKHPWTTHTQYGQRNYCCDLHSWGDAPLETKETHFARRMAHKAFDQLWKRRYMSRSNAYKWLAQVMELPRKECHIKLMNTKQANRVIQFVNTEMERIQYARF